MGGRRVLGVFDFESALPGDPVEDFIWTADHGQDSPVFTAFVAGYLERGQLDADAPERLAFYQLEHCLEVPAGPGRRTDPGSCRPSG
jgi:aminoglycoside phosphotransferase (APT) family kinase protein